MKKWWIPILLLVGWLGIVANGMGLFGGAKALPGWNVSKICAEESDPGHCKTLESAAQKTISGAWDLIPDAYRDACLGEFAQSEDQSYRALSQCLEQQALKGLDKNVVKTAATAEADPMVALLAERASWGTGPSAKTIEAPLATGAVVPLPKSAARVEQAGSTADTIVHEAVSSPAATLTPVPQDQIAKQMAAFLVERESWGTAPIPARMTIPEAVTALLAERDSWGAGPSPVQVAAPLAAGAIVPLPKSAARVEQAGATPKTIVHQAVITPPAELTQVPQDQISKQMAALLDERESWGTAPSLSSATPSGAAVSKDQIVKALSALLAERASWGTAPSLSSQAALDTASTSQQSNSSSDQIRSALDALLAERESWGKAP